MLRKSRQLNSEEAVELLPTKLVPHTNKHSLFFSKKPYKLFFFNKDFSGWSIIKEKLFINGLSNENDNIPQLMISPKCLNDLFKQDLLDADLAPPAQMMLK